MLEKLHRQVSSFLTPGHPVLPSRVAKAAKLAALSLAFVLLAQPITAQTRGYTSRACGFDLDDDGIIGEAEDCTICDASVSGGIVQSDGTDDPDGDGVNEDILYVDCDSGTDSSSCGTEGQTPCLTIAQAIANADGVGDGAEDIVCFTGTCTATPGIVYSDLKSGVAGVRTKTATGSEEIDFQFPTNPNMIIGWDADNDGQYPPFDTDDTSVLDGQDADQYCLRATHSRSRVELAHFSCTDWGPGNNSQSSGGIRISSQSIDSSHIYWHDIELTNINDTQTWAGHTPYALSVGSQADRNYYAFINMQWSNVGGFWIRGNCISSSSCSPLRWQNITYTALGASSGATVMMDIYDNWGTATQPLEFLDSDFDGNIENWTVGSGAACGGGSNAPPEGFNPESSVQSLVIRNNVFRNICSLLQIEDSGISGNERQTQGHIVDRNEWVIDSAASGWTGTVGITITDGGAAGDSEFFNGASITNNTFRVVTDSASQCCIDIDARDETVGAVTPDGTVTIAHNTFDVLPSSGPIIDIHPSGTSHIMNYVIYNNIFNNTGAFANISTNWPDNGVTFTTDGNIFDSAGDFVFDGGATDATLAAWQSTLDTCSNHICVGGDDNSTEACTPSFVNASDLRLTSGDTCALNQAQDGSAYTITDIDGSFRPQGVAWDVGADEVSGGTPPTLPGTSENLRRTDTIE